MKYFCETSQFDYKEMFYSEFWHNFAETTRLKIITFEFDTLL